MHKVKHAIIMAAGKGTRLKPITDVMPKPLIKVNGTTMIESIISALHSNKIYKIYIVVGYLKEQFEFLKKKYRGIKLIFNPYFDTCNNISSLFVIRDHISNAIILDGDQIIKNYKVLSVEFEKSCYNVVWCPDDTNEWLLSVMNDSVKSCSRVGGYNGWQLYSISRWTKSDGKKLKKYLEKEFILNRNRSIYWDDIPLNIYLNNFNLGIFKMNQEDVCEIDCIDELKTIDKTYANSY